MSIVRGNLTIFVMLALLALPAFAFDEPRSVEDAAFQDMLWGHNLSTGYEQQNQYDSNGNYWHMVGFNNKFYQSAEKYTDEGLVLIQTNDSVIALWAIAESWSLTNDTAKLEEESIRSLDMTGIEHVKIIDYSLPRVEYNRNIVLFARDEMPLEDMTNETLDAWIKVMTEEMDHLKSQYSLAPTLDNDWIWEAGYEQILDAPEMIIEPHTTVRAVRDNPSIPEYPMWMDETEPVVTKPVITYGNITLEGWDLDGSSMQGRSCTPTQDGVPEGNCPLDRDQSIFLLKNSGNETVDVDGWRIVWYEEISPVDHDDYRRNIIEINYLVIPGNTQVEYEYQYPYGPDYISPEGGLYLYDADGVLVDQFGPEFYEELTVVDQKFETLWERTAGTPVVFVNSREFLGLRLL